MFSGRRKYLPWIHFEFQVSVEQTCHFGIGKWFAFFAVVVVYVLLNFHNYKK